jgi:hypothetical protein
MFTGHLAVGLIGKRIEPGISLGTLTLAVMLADLIVYPLLIGGVESINALPVGSNRIVGENIAYSHSLLMDGVWATLVAAAYYWRRRYPRGAWILFAAVLSHWALDVISHRPDMPIAPGTSWRFGLGLWNSFPAAVAIEGGFWLIAIILYVRSSRAKTWVGVYVFWLGIALSTLLWLGNIRADMDPNPIRAGTGGLIVFSIIIAWAYWMNRARATQFGDSNSPAAP